MGFDCDVISECLKPAKGRLCLFEQLVAETVPAFTAFCLHFCSPTQGRPVCVCVVEKLLPFEENPVRSSAYSIPALIASYRGSEYAYVQARRVDRRCASCSKAQRNPQKSNLCVLESSSCRELLGSTGMQGRPVAGLMFVLPQTSTILFVQVSPVWNIYCTCSLTDCYKVLFPVKCF